MAFRRWSAFGLAMQLFVLFATLFTDGGKPLVPNRPLPLPTAVRILLLTILFGSSVLSAQIVRDRLPPTAPTNLVVTATTEHSVSLAWGPSTDNSGRFSYIICCAGTTVTVSQTATSHTLEGLKSGATYVLRVYAKDAAGNLSKSSNP